jgi:hypothetical protein
VAFESVEIPLKEDNAAVVAELQKVVTNTSNTAQNTQSLEDMEASLSSIDSHVSEIETSVELIDDAVYADDADWTAGTSKHILVGGIYQSSPQTVTNNDTAPIELDVNGKIIESNSGSIKTAVELIDDAVATTGVAITAKGLAAAGTDGTNARILKTDTSGELQVDVLSIAAGTNTIGSVRLTDPYGWRAEFTPMDEVRVVEPVRLAGSTFVGATVDTNFWTAAVTNDGTVTQGSGIVTLDTATTSANGTAKITSVATARYMGASSNRYRAQISLNNTGAADNTRNWGVRNGTTDGAYFQLSGTTLNIVTLKNSSETAVASGSWNGSAATYTLTNCTTYEIYWTNKSVYFVINGTLVHTVTTTTATWADTLNFQVFAETINANSLQTSQTIVIRVNTIVRLGKEMSVPRSYYFAAGQIAAQVLKRAPGTLHRILISQVTNNASITLWDNVAASTTTIWTSGAMGALTTPFYIEFGIPFTTGLTLTVATANASVVVVYE